MGAHSKVLSLHSVRSHQGWLSADGKRVHPDEVVLVIGLRSTELLFNTRPPSKPRTSTISRLLNGLAGNAQALHKPGTAGKMMNASISPKAKALHFFHLLQVALSVGNVETGLRT